MPTKSKLLPLSEVLDLASCSSIDWARVRRMFLLEDQREMYYSNLKTAKKYPRNAVSRPLNKGSLTTGKAP